MMRSTSILVWLTTFAAGALTLTSCSGTIHVGGRPHAHPSVVVMSPGPPPHAPAHGYRHKHGGLVLLYDASLDVYIVDGHAGYYYCRDRYYRVRGNAWQVSFDFGGPWRVIPDTHLPKKLHAHQVASAKHKHKHKHK